jgi:hypothetical protein
MEDDADGGALALKLTKEPFRGLAMGTAGSDEHFKIVSRLAGMNDNSA